MLVKVKTTLRRTAYGSLKEYFFDAFGAAREIRTPDLLITNQPLCRLSYGGIWRYFILLKNFRNPHTLTKNQKNYFLWFFCGIKTVIFIYRLNEDNKERAHQCPKSAII